MNGVIDVIVFSVYFKLRLVLECRAIELASVGELFKFIFLIAVQYTNEEMSDWLLVFGYCQGNGLQSCKVCSERFQIVHYRTIEPSRQLNDVFVK